MEASTVVVGADFGETGDEAIRLGLDMLAAGTTRALYVVHALDDGLLPPEDPEEDLTFSAPLALESLRARVRKLAQARRIPLPDGRVRVEVHSGRALPVLLEAVRAHRADLAIVGSHRRRGIDRLLSGSVAEALVRSADCSVLIARPPRAPSPLPSPAPEDGESARESRQS